MEDSLQALFYSLFLNVTGDETDETNMIFTERADLHSTKLENKELMLQARRALASCFMI